MDTAGFYVTAPKAKTLMLKFAIVRNLRSQRCWIDKHWIPAGTRRRIRPRQFPPISLPIPYLRITLSSDALKIQILEAPPSKAVINKHMNLHITASHEIVPEHSIF